MTIAEEIDQRIRDAEQSFIDVLDDAFKRSLSLSSEEIMRRNNEALGRLLSEEPKPWQS